MSKRLSKAELLYTISCNLALDYEDRDVFENDVYDKRGKKWFSLIKENCSNTIAQQFKKNFC